MTYEKAIEILDSSKKFFNTNAMEAIDLAIEALQKQVPMKKEESHFEHDPGWGCGKIQCFEYHCPKCKKLIDFEIDYCDGCGQRILWEE